MRKIRYMIWLLPLLPTTVGSVGIASVPACL